MAAEKPLTAAELREGIRLITARVQVISHITTATDQGREDHFRALGALIVRAGDLGSDDPWLARNSLRRLREPVTPDPASSGQFVHTLDHPATASHHHQGSGPLAAFVSIPDDQPVVREMQGWHHHQLEDPS